MFRAGQLGASRSSSPTSRPPARASAGAAATRIRCSAPPGWRTPRGRRESREKRQTRPRYTPAEPNFSSFARDLFSAEEQGMMPGFQGKDWWAVGSMDATTRSRGGDGRRRRRRRVFVAARRDDRAVRRRANRGRFDGWRPGFDGVLVRRIRGVGGDVRSSCTGLTADDLYGDGRMKFLPAALLSLRGTASGAPVPHGGDARRRRVGPAADGGAARCREASRARAHPRTVGDARGDWRARAECTAKLSIWAARGSTGGTRR